MGTEIALIALVVIVVLALSAERAAARVRDARLRYRNLITKKNSQADRIKKAALESLYLKRERRQMRLTREELQADYDRLAADIQRVARPENRIFVLDERRAPADQTWLLPITATPVEGHHPPPWTGVRRFQVWAVDEDTAKVKASKKYPAAHGYTLGEPVRRGKAGAKAGAD